MTDNKEIPQEVREKITQIVGKEFGYASNAHRCYTVCEEVYLLSQQALEEKDKRIRELEEKVKDTKSYYESALKLIIDSQQKEIMKHHIR
jgi:hypothetical protein